MFYISTPSVESISKELNKLGMTPIRTTFKKFMDGEWYVRIDEPEKVKDEIVTLIGNTTHDPENLIQLLLLVNAARNSGAAKINLVIPYFGYQKQDHIVEQGEAVSAVVMAELIKSTSPDKLVGIVLHSDVTRQILGNKLSELNLAELLADEIRSLKLVNPVIASPDEGSMQRDIILAHELGDIEMISAEKERTKNKIGIKTLKFDSTSLRGRDVILADDFVQSGGTIEAAVERLRSLKARSISLVLYHGFLFKEGYERVAKLNFENIIITNTLPFPGNSSSVKIVSVAELVKDCIL